MNFLTSLKDWIILPKAQEVGTLQQVQDVVDSIPNHFDVSVEWIPSKAPNDGSDHKENRGFYRVTPFREICFCSMPGQDSISINKETKEKITKQVMREELINIVTNSNTSSATVQPEQKEPVKITRHQQRQIKWKKELHEFAINIGDSIDKTPHAPVNREFLNNIFEGHKLATIIPIVSKHHASQEVDILEHSKLFKASNEHLEISNLINQALNPSGESSNSKTNMPREPQLGRRIATLKTMVEGSDKLSSDTKTIILKLLNQKSENNWLKTILLSTTEIDASVVTQNMKQARYDS